MRTYAAEAIGTFVLVFGGCGAAVLAGEQIGFAGVAAAFGLSLLAMVYALGPISGCHLNPAVTLGLVIAGKFPAERAPGYVAAQVVGAVAAAALLLVVAQGNAQFDAVAGGFASNGYGARSPGGYGLGSALVIEVAMTALLVMTILGATDVRAPVGLSGVAIGSALTLIHLVSIPVTNTSVNPVRSLGPALFAGSGALSQLWLFIVAPLIGAVLAAAVYRLIRAADPVVQIPATQALAALAAQQAARAELAADALAGASGTRVR